MLDRYKQFISRKSYKNPLVIKDLTVQFVVKILRLLFIIGLCYLFLFPLIFMVTVALQNPASANDPSVVWIPKSISFESIRTALQVLDYKSSIMLTATISIFSTFFTLITCSIVGYGFARFNFFEKKLAFGLVLLTVIVPPQTILISSYLNFRFFDFGGILKLLSPLTGHSSINLLNTIWTYLLPTIFATGLRAGLFIFIFRQFFMGMPKDMEEAARIDGCGSLQTFFRIIVPLAVPVFITVMLFSFIWHWNELYASTMYFTGNVRPITAMLNQMNSLLENAGKASIGQYSQYQLRTYSAAGALVTILPPLVLYIFTQRYFTESIERTGIVG